MVNMLVPAPLLPNFEKRLVRGHFRGICHEVFEMVWNSSGRPQISLSQLHPAGSTATATNDHCCSGTRINGGQSVAYQNDTEFLSMLSHSKSENAEMIAKVSTQTLLTTLLIGSFGDSNLGLCTTWSAAKAPTHAECHTRTDDKDELPNLGPATKFHTKKISKRIICLCWISLKSLVAWHHWGTPVSLEDEFRLIKHQGLLSLWQRCQPGPLVGANVGRSSAYKPPYK